MENKKAPNNTNLTELMYVNEIIGTIMNVTETKEIKIRVIRVIDVPKNKSAKRENLLNTTFILTLINVHPSTGFKIIIFCHRPKFTKKRRDWI